MRLRILITALLLAAPAAAQGLPVAKHYDKQEVMVPMRDGVELFTAIYTPKDASRAYPILLFRTPYSVRPYGVAAFKDKLGPTEAFTEDGYVFVYQDVRGKYMSEGNFRNMTPHVATKNGPEDVDESTDTYDTIEWVLANVQNHNGRVGQWGISYPGFYAAAGMIDAHPALKAVSPQAPIADWWYDDFHHHGALFLPHCFNFISSFGQPRPVPTTERSPRFDHGTPDGYEFFLNAGSAHDLNENHLKGQVEFWNAVIEHPNRDEFWQARDLLPHLKNVTPAVMTVGGWFDAEDLYGPLAIYRTIEANNPGIENVLVMGPWVHGGWNRTAGDRLGAVEFGPGNSHKYQTELERPFFRHHLYGDPAPAIAEATVFETGTNRWRQFDQWPPAAAQQHYLYFNAHGKLSPWRTGSDVGNGVDRFVSDPAKPVPYTQNITTGMVRTYMVEDQRFAARRPDVLVYQTEVLDEPLTLAGPVVAELFVRSTEEDADWVVKLIDVYPADAPDPSELRTGMRMGGYQQMVRSEVLRGRFDDDPACPKPMPGKITSKVTVELQDVLHTFKPGHRIMVQVQSTWFPLVDRNPQNWVDNIYKAQPDDYRAATHSVYRNGKVASRIRIGVLEE